MKAILPAFATECPFPAGLYLGGGGVKWPLANRL